MTEITIQVGHKYYYEKENIIVLVTQLQIKPRRAEVSIGPGHYFWVDYKELKAIPKTQSQ